MKVSQLRATPRATPRASQAAVTVAAAAVYAIGLGRPGLWRDEGATIAACRRSLPELFDLTRHVDLVHLAYYLIAHVVWQVSPSVVAVRSISLVAMALTAGLMVGIGHRLGSDRLGVLAGLVFVAVPFTSRFAQEARSFALVTLVATGCTWALVGFLTGRASRWRLAGYGLGLVLLGLLNVIALLLVVVHAVIVFTVATRSFRRTWVLTVAPAMVLVAPFVLASMTQRGQISWMTRPGLKEPWRLAALDFGGLLSPLIIVLVLAAVAGVMRRRPEGVLGQAAWFGALWGLLPPALLWLASQVTPMWDYHYLLFSLPGLVLLIAALVPGTKTLPSLLVLLVVIAVGLPQQVADRRHDGHWGEDLTELAAYLGPRTRPGDAVVFVPSDLRVVAADYPEAFADLEDVALRTSPVESGTLKGVLVEANEIEARLAGHRRVWLVRGTFLPDEQLPGLDRATLSVLSRQYTVQTRVTLSDVDVSLDVRSG